MHTAHYLLLSSGLALAMVPPVARAEPAGRITSFGGLFVRHQDSEALSTWHREFLGLALEPWGGAMLK